MNAPDIPKHPISTGREDQSSKCWREHEPGWICLRPEGHSSWAVDPTLQNLQVWTQEAATQNNRSDSDRWVWSPVINTMVSDSHKVTMRYGQMAADGAPLAHAFALNFLETLYRGGFVIAERRDWNEGNPT